MSFTYDWEYILYKTLVSQTDFLYPDTINHSTGTTASDERPKSWSTVDAWLGWNMPLMTMSMVLNRNYGSSFITRHSLQFRPSSLQASSYVFWAVVFVYVRLPTKFVLGSMSRMHVPTIMVIRYFRQKREQKPYFPGRRRGRRQLSPRPTKSNGEPIRYWLQLGQKHELGSYNRHQRANQLRHP